VLSGKLSIISISNAGEDDIAMEKRKNEPMYIDIQPTRLESQLTDFRIGSIVTECDEW
jgi:hypothetical protein